MTLDRIALSRFRNHAETALDRTGKFNLLVGENGAGKTNVLEALSLLAPGRGLRRARAVEMACTAADGGFSVAASLIGDGEPVRLATHTLHDNPARRLVQVNGAPASAAGLGEWLAIGWLTPAMDGLFADSAGARRHFMDRLAVALEPTHARHAVRYEAALRERNRLLAKDALPERAWFEGVEAQLAEHGAELAAGRSRLVDRLTDALARHPDEPFARPRLIYRPGSPIDESELRHALGAARSGDRAAQRTRSGPHRDELEVTMSSTGMPAALSSTGEQKAMLIAITLAHAELSARERPSVLLLDEVAAHLDPLRRAALFERLAQGRAQVWMTGTETAPFETILADSTSWRVVGGRVAQLA